MGVRGVEAENVGAGIGEHDGGRGQCGIFEKCDSGSAEQCPLRAECASGAAVDGRELAGGGGGCGARRNGGGGVVAIMNRELRSPLECGVLVGGDASEQGAAGGVVRDAEEQPERLGASCCGGDGGG